MVWPEDIASDLPNPHPEEPASLRSDILDELYDHLLSSLEHEQLTEADETAARRSVLARFGNPAAIACRLWWDAMWRSIMLQRITLGFVALLCCLSIVMTFMVWQAIGNSQQATAALVAQVQKLAERTEAPAKPEDERLKYLDWVPVTVKLEYEDGTPVTDENVDATFGTSQWKQNVPQRSVSKHPDETGTLSFGFFKPGEMELKIRMPWNETFSTSFSLEPGFPVEMTIACPRKELELVPAKVTFDWPDELRDRALWVHLTMGRKSRDVAGNQWYDQNQAATLWELLIDPEGNCYRTGLFASADDINVRFNNPYFRIHDLDYLVLGKNEKEMYERHPHEIQSAGTINRFRQDMQKEFDRFCGHVRYAELSQTGEELMLPEQGIRITHLYFLRRAPNADVNETIGFQTVLPIDYLESVQLSQSDNWTYQPSQEMIELVRKRLEQIDAAEKPGEEGKTQAAKP